MDIRILRITFFFILLLILPNGCSVDKSIRLRELNKIDFFCFGDHSVGGQHGTNYYVDFKGDSYLAIIPFNSNDFSSLRHLYTDEEFYSLYGLKLDSMVSMPKSQIDSLLCVPTDTPLANDIKDICLLFRLVCITCKKNNFYLQQWTISNNIATLYFVHNKYYYDLIIMKDKSIYQDNSFEYLAPGMFYRIRYKLH